LKEAMTPLLPRTIIDRPKKGFNAPVLSWVKELLPVIKDVLRNGIAVQQGILNSAAVHRVVAESRGSVVAAQRTWLLLVLELWCRVFLGDTAGAKPEFTLHDLRS
jgi:asparagine synthase (glutamine-hydrolysing)